MPDQEAKDNPESFVSDEEMYEAAAPDVGDGTPETAPEVTPKLSLRERVKLALQ
jgi:hypothetical protein